MKCRLSFITLICILLSSCVDTLFNRAPGNNLNQIPTQFHGDYYSVKEEISKEGRNRYDTTFFHIEANGWETVASDSSHESTYLSDSVTISSYGNFFFLNFIDKCGTWSLSLLVKKKEDNIIVPLSQAEEGAEGIESKRAIVEKQKKWREELAKYFETHLKYCTESTDTITIYQMNEDKLIEYMEKNRKDLSEAILIKYKK